MRFLVTSIDSYNVDEEYMDALKGLKVETLLERNTILAPFPFTVLEIDTLEEFIKVTQAVKGRVVFFEPEYYNSCPGVIQKIISEHNLDGHVEIYDGYRE